jgi:hypothetical protein
MARLDLTEDEAETLRENLDIDIEAWEDELEQVCMQPHDSWVELLENSSFSAKMVEVLTRVRNQLVQ